MYYLKKVIYFILLFIVPELYAQNKLEIFKKNGLFGYKNSFNEIVIEAIFEEAMIFNGDYAIVKKNDFYAIINQNGKYVLTAQYKTIQYLTDSLVYLIDKESNKSIYSISLERKIVRNIEKLVQRKDNIIIYKKKEANRPLSSLEILYLSNNNICNLGKYTNIDLIDNSRISYTLEDKESGIINLENCKVSSVKKLKTTSKNKNITKKFNNNIVRIIFEKNKLKGLKDNKDNIILQPIYEELYFDGNYPVVYGFSLKNDEYSGEIFNINGQKVINRNFEDIPSSEYSRSLADGTLAVQGLNKKYGIIDIKGNVLQEFIYTDIYALKNYGHYVAYIYDYKTNNHRGFLFNNKGKTILNEFELLFSYNHNLIKYKKNGYIGLINHSGVKILNNIYDDIFMNEDKFIVLKNDKYGLISNSEKEIIPIKYDYLSFSNNKIHVFQDKKEWGYITSYGKEIFRTQADNLSSINDNIGIVTINNFQYHVKANKRGKYEIVK